MAKAPNALDGTISVRIDQKPCALPAEAYWAALPVSLSVAGFAWIELPGWNTFIATRPRTRAIVVMPSK